MLADESCDHLPVDHPASPTVDTRGMGIQQDPVGMVAGSGGEVVGMFNPDSLEEGKTFMSECITVGEVLVSVKLRDINETTGKERAGQVGFSIDEDSNPENAVLERGKELPGSIQGTIAPAFRPEVDPEGVDSELGQLIGLRGVGDATDLKGGGSAGEKTVQKWMQGSIMKDGG